MRATLPLALAFLLAASPAAAQQRRLDTLRLRPALDAAGFLGFQGAHVPDALVPTLAYWTHYERSPVVGILSTSAGDEFDLIGHRLVGDLAAQIGLGHGLALGFEVPFVLEQVGDGTSLRDGEGALSGSALADPRWLVRWRFWGQKRGLRAADGPALGLLVRGTLPLGDAEALAGDEQVTIEAQLTGDFHLIGLGIGAMIGYRGRPFARELGGAAFQHELQYAVGLKVPLPWVQGLQVQIEARGVFDAEFRGGATTLFEADLGAALRRGPVLSVLTLGAGFASAVGSPAVRAGLGLLWSPLPDDADGDGIADGDDECPQLAEDMDGFQDADGCRDPDNDNDFIPDEDDRCPNEEALEGQDEDEDGCTDPS